MRIGTACSHTGLQTGVLSGTTVGEVNPRLAWQPSLLGSGPVEPDREFRTLRRLQLDDRSWVDYAPGWLDGADELFDELLRIGSWQQREVWMYERKVREPRLTAGWRGAGTRTWSREDVAQALREVDAEPVPDLMPGGDSGTGVASLPPPLSEIAAVLSERYGVDFDSVWVNLYRDGRDSVAWHGDTIGRSSTEDTMVAIVSIGTPRVFALRPRTGGRALRMTQGHGDLLVMGGSCQRTWEHSVPKTARPTGPRISIQFRPRGVR